MASGDGKHSKVLEWLQDMFGDEPVPPFCANDDFIDHLYELMTRERDLAESTQVYNEFVTTSAHDHSADLKSTLNILKQLGISNHVESPDSQTDVLASVANSLSLSSVDESNYVLSLTDLLMAEEKTTADVASMSKSIESDKKNLASAEILGDQLESLTNKLSQQRLADEETAKKGEREIKFFQNKMAKYQADQHKQKKRLADAGVKKDVTHARLVADYNELKGVQDKLNNTRNELAMYAGLPADKSLARVKLEVAKSELKEIEDELAREIDISHL